MEDIRRVYKTKSMSDRHLLPVTQEVANTPPHKTRKVKIIPPKQDTNATEQFRIRTKTFETGEFTKTVRTRGVKSSHKNLVTSSTLADINSFNDSEDSTPPKAVKILSKVEEGYSSPNFQRKARVCESGEYGKVRIGPGLIVPTLDLSAMGIGSSSTPKKSFGGFNVDIGRLRTAVQEVKTRLRD